MHLAQPKDAPTWGHTECPGNEKHCAAWGSSQTTGQPAAPKPGLQPFALTLKKA